MTRLIGLLMFIGASLGLIKIYSPLIRSYLPVVPFLISQQVEARLSDSESRLIIPKINVNEPIVFGVDAGNEMIYSQALKQGVAQAAGTAFPGTKGLGYYFGHSSADLTEHQKVVFAGLDRLGPKDIIEIYYNNTTYTYEVVSKTIVEPSDVSWLQPQGGGEYIVLQTCWPVGTNAKRLLVVARPVNKDVSGVDSRGAFGKISFAMKRTK